MYEGCFWHSLCFHWEGKTKSLNLSPFRPWHHKLPDWLVQVRLFICLDAVTSKRWQSLALWDWYWGISRCRSIWEWDEGENLTEFRKMGHQHRANALINQPYWRYPATSLQWCGVNVKFWTSRGIYELFI